MQGVFVEKEEEEILVEAVGMSALAVELVNLHPGLLSLEWLVVVSLLCWRPLLRNEGWLTPTPFPND